MTTDELLHAADRQGFNVSELGLEFMERVDYMQQYIDRLEKEIAELDHPL
jgi:hypothetical protein